MYGGLNPSNGESGLTATGSFSDEGIRLRFIRKVYGILTLQLAITVGIMGIFLADTVKVYAFENIWMFWTAFFLSLVLMIALSCFGELRRKSPYNLICLVAFTVVEGILLGVVTATYSAEEVLMAVGICFAVTLALTLFAFQTRFDFTACSGMLLAFLVGFLLFGIFCAIFPGRVISLLYASLGALVFSFYIVFDTQLMIGGKYHSYALDPEEYIFACLNLYIDIINLLLMILRLIRVGGN